MKRAALTLAVAACGSPQASGGPLATFAAPSPLSAITLADLVGGWQWQLATTEAGTSRVELETWRFAPSGGDATRLAGRYIRDVEVIASDRAPFACDQRPAYRQRAVFDVTAQLAGTDDTAFVIHETDATTEPSACDHGFRHLGDYRGTLTGSRFVLTFDDGGQPGTETLWRTDDRLAPLPDAPWPAHYDLAGPWRWHTTSLDADGNLRDETEWWQITRRTDTAVDATYRRRVTVRSPDGTPIACAHAPSYSFDDAYVLAGEREEEHWHLHELAADPGDHPCIRATPERDLDEGTAEQIGDYLVVEWRGKRRQVLYRPD